MRIKFTIDVGGVTRFRDLSKRTRDAVGAGLDAAGAMFVDALKLTAPGKDLKAAISFQRAGLSLQVGSFDGPPWAAISEFGGDIKAKNYTFKVYDVRAPRPGGQMPFSMVGPLLQIPLFKGARGQPGVRIYSAAGNIVKLAYDPGSKTVGGPIAVLKPQVYHPPANAGKGWLLWVIEAHKGEAIALVREAINEAVSAAA